MEKRQKPHPKNSPETVTWSFLYHLWWAVYRPPPIMSNSFPKNKLRPSLLPHISFSFIFLRNEWSLVPTSDLGFQVAWCGPGSGFLLCTRSYPEPFSLAHINLRTRFPAVWHPITPEQPTPPKELLGNPTKVITRLPSFHLKGHLRCPWQGHLRHQIILTAHSISSSLSHHYKQRWMGIPS